ncbi:prosaposin-like [Dioscorea cayenensis subsp. rotundata]|uniref:Pulmonary surfactant-associated protein B n=1 Tax=Dioscorea cayennensis subsp. rotundata TaxID=55577 RepID=A0AB40AGG7_DIOCR|nr:prosaposin-like [Dioscorea cayenensis subsp. rotundata]
MGLKIVLLALFVLSISWISSGAKDLSASDITGVPIEYKNIGEEKIHEVVEKNNQLCTICEEYTAEALSVLGENKTQMDIISILHKACSQLRSLEEQCIGLVDYYASVFFLEISTIQPENFCQKLSLCGAKYFSLHRSDNNICRLCHQVVLEIITKLKDPDTQFEIIEILLNQCSKAENYAQECKRLVFEYGPLILASGEKFFETNDVCSIVLSCTSSKTESIGSAQITEASLTDA